MIYKRACRYSLSLMFWRRGDLHQLAQLRIEISSFCEPKAQPALVGKRDNDVPTFLILDSEQSLLFSFQSYFTRNPAHTREPRQTKALVIALAGMRTRRILKRELQAVYYDIN